MAMLAEKKHKQKWTLNPRGKYWSEDSNKFGQKMLEKMGWTSGKGLGANEDGITEHIKVSYKNDSQGIGFKDDGEQWTQHESNFSNLLQSLTENSSVDLKKPETSLEVKSQSSRARVHYHKFTRSKDLSRYSEKDLANIFGRKSLHVSKNSDVESYSDDVPKNFGVDTVGAGSMTDYFKRKISNLGDDYNINKRKAESSESDCEIRLGFGSTKLQVDTVENNIDTQKSKQIKFVKSDTDTLNDHCEVQALKIKEKKTKSKKKSKEIEIISNGIDNEGLNISFEDDNVNSCNEIENKNKCNELKTNVSTKSKVKHKKNKYDQCYDNPCLQEFVENEHVTNIKDFGHKKNKHSGNKNNKNIFEYIGEAVKLKKRKTKSSVADQEDATNKCELSNKKIKQGIDNPCFQNAKFNESCENEDFDESVKNSLKSIKKKRKINHVDSSCNKKKKKDLELGIDNPGFTAGVLNLENDMCSKKRSAKKKKIVKLDVIPEEILEDSIDTSQKSEVKKKSKKNRATETEETIKNYSSYDDGIDNPACTANSAAQGIEETIASMASAIDCYQNELENQINDTKDLGENNIETTSENWDDEHKTFKETLSYNTQKLNLKFIRNAQKEEKKKCVRGIIKGKIKIDFAGTNVENIIGYGINT